MAFFPFWILPPSSIVKAKKVDCPSDPLLTIDQITQVALELFKSGKIYDEKT